MKKINTLLLVLCIAIFSSCDNDDNNSQDTPLNTTVNFQYKSTINVGGEGASEISAFDAATNKLYVVNVASNQISVF